MAKRLGGQVVGEEKAGKEGYGIEGKERKSRKQCVAYQTMKQRRGSPVNRADN